MAKKATPLEVPEDPYYAHTILTPEALDEAIEEYQKAEYLVFDVETVASRAPRAGRKGSDVPALDERTNRVLWIALAAPGLLDVIPIGHPDVGDHKAPAQLERHQVMSGLKPLFFSDKPKINHNVKFDILSLAKYWGEIPSGPFGDTHTVVHLLNENLMDYSLGALTERYLGFTYRKLAKEGVPMDLFPFESVARYVGLDAKLTQLLYELQVPRTKRGRLAQVLQLENDITEVLIWAKQRGVMLDRDALVRLDVSLTETMTEMVKGIHALAGHPFNVNSNAQLGKVLYEELGLPVKEKTKTGNASVAKSALEPLIRKHKIIPALLEYNKVAKLQSTYSKGLLPFIEDDNRIRCGLNQSGTVTGRFSSSKPNLQNIPRQSEDEDAARVRAMFMASPGHALVVGDYGQIEARLMAHYGGPLVKHSKLMAAFTEGIDFHTMTAMGLFSKPADQITKEERQAGKTANFLLIFGGGAQRLIATGGYTEKLAEQTVERFHKTYPEIDRFSAKIITEARRMKTPTLETITGRRRRLPDLNLPRDNWQDRKLRGAAERQALNYVIQGSAADINKMAMVRAFRRIQRAGKLGVWHILLSVHDEIILEVPERDADRGIALLREAMEGVHVDLRVPLVADIHAGPNWAAAK